MFTAFRYQGKYTNLLGEFAADTLRRIGQQHSNRNRKKASQEYLVNAFASQKCLVPALYLQSNPSRRHFLFYLVLVCLSHSRPSLAEHVYLRFVTYKRLFFLLSLFQRYYRKSKWR